MSDEIVEILNITVPCNECHSGRIVIFLLHDSMMGVCLSCKNVRNIDREELIEMAKKVIFICDRPGCGDEIEDENRAATLKLSIGNQSGELLNLDWDLCEKCLEQYLNGLVDRISLKKGNVWGKKKPTDVVTEVSNEGMF